MKDFLLKEKELVDFLTGKSTIALNRRFLRNFRMADIDITIEQWSVLNILWQGDGITQQSLSHRTFKDKPSITRLINNLEKLNLVVRIPDKADRRINLIFLTQKGRMLEDTTHLPAEKTMQDALAGVSKSKLQVYKEVLAQIFKNLE